MFLVVSVCLSVQGGKGPYVTTLDLFELLHLGTTVLTQMGTTTYMGDPPSTHPPDLFKPVRHLETSIPGPV